MASDRVRKQIGNAFTYHRPHGTQPQRYEKLRKMAMDLAFEAERMCPDSRELSLAMTKLEEFVMWANASIARNEVAPPEPIEDAAPAKEPAKEPAAEPEKK